jgi:hypothetical protein
MNKFTEKKMKKTFITSLLLFTLILTACGGARSSQTNSNSNQNFGSTPLPLAMQLVVGTFKLEGTDKAVTVEEAKQLLPLWQVYKDLSVSTSAAQEEIDALANQIQGTMTPEQVQAITDMKLSRRDISQTMQDLGIETANRPNASGTPRPGGQGGNFPGGGPGGAPGGGQGFNNGQNLSPQQIATFQARRAQNGGTGGQSNRIPPALFDALIKLLQSKK